MTTTLFAAADPLPPFMDLSAFVGMTDVGLALVDPYLADYFY